MSAYHLILLTLMVLSIGFLCLTMTTQPLICNRCYQMTKKEFLVRDIGYDDWGYQCMVCANKSGLLDRQKEVNEGLNKILKERKEAGID